MRIDMYSTGCPRCRVLEKRLNESLHESGNTLNIITDEEEIMAKAKEFGLEEVPFVIADGKLYRFSEAMKMLR